MPTRYSLRFTLLILAPFLVGLIAGNHFYPNKNGEPNINLVTSATAQPDGSSNLFSKIAKQNMPGVVNISSTRTKGKQGHQFQDERMREFYKRFFPGMPVPPSDDSPRQSLGSGFVVEKSGYILTNNHVIEKADEIIVTFGDGSASNIDKQYKAKVIGADPKTDVALIKIEGDHDFPALNLGNSNTLEVGEWVMAIGNPFGFAKSVTVGVVSAKGRAIGAGPYDNFIQTDASINPGNSGGPLLNVAGEVVGINTAIYTGGSQGNIGIGFSIPISTVKGLYEDLKKGEIHRGWLGVMIQPVTPEIESAMELDSRLGALVGDVFKGSPADKAGVERGDVIVKFDGDVVQNAGHLPRVVATRRPGTTVSLTVIRNGKEKKISMRLGEMPKDAGKSASPGMANEQEKTELLGMTAKDITSEDVTALGLTVKSGVVITQVVPGGPAGKAGVRKGDVVLQVNRKKIKGMKKYRSIISSVKKGESVLMLLSRGGNTLIVAVKVAK